MYVNFPTYYSFFLSLCQAWKLQYESPTLSYYCMSFTIKSNCSATQIIKLIKIFFCQKRPYIFCECAPNREKYVHMAAL